MTKQIFSFSIIIVVFVTCYASAFGKTKPVFMPEIPSIIDTGKTSTEAEADYYHHRQPVRRLSKNKFRKKRRLQSTVHLGKKPKPRERTWQKKVQPTMFWWSLGILVMALVVGVMLLVEVMGLFWATISLGILALLELILPFIDDIGFEVDFGMAFIALLFSLVLGWLSINLIGLWLLQASLFSAGTLVLTWSLAGFLLAIVTYFILRLVWKAIRKFFRFIILLLTLGFVDIDK